MTIAGIPLLHVYCFATWLVAIALGGWLARRMDRGSAAADPGEAHPGDGA